MQPNTNRILRSTLSATGAAALGGAALAAWGNRELENFRLHEVTVPLLPPGTLRGDSTDFRILHISDLHMLPGQDTKREWVSSLIDTDPDLVVNTGDNLGDAKTVPDVLRALGPLLSRPGLFVFGSNDYWAPRPVNPLGYLARRKRPVSDVELPWRDMRAAFVEHGWRDATHARCEFKAGHVRIAAAGVDDPHHDLDDYDTIAGPPHRDCDLALALSHAPEPAVLRRFADDGYQLALCGHTHGGQICLPGGRAIVTNCGINARRAKGLSHLGPMHLHVSEGLGTSRYAPVRLFCPPAATLLRITEHA
ncbi:metallophosphoesterase [Corynebacterium pygosceleis]|uniref:metallophosphoesterase n=1 Tax=Corynebacterium pygosceleis TaxID=2800406 RepID=UPI003AF01538